MNNDQHKASLINLNEKVILKFDRLSQCYNESDPDLVKSTCGLLLDDHYQKNIPGMKVTANARYHVSCQIPVPFSGVKKSIITLEAGPRRPGVSSFRIDFNPAKLSSSGLTDFLSLLQSSIDADTTEFFRHGKVTRCDFALDFPEHHVVDVIVRSSRTQKHGLYSDRYGDPQTIYCGTPRSRCVVAYEKPIEGSSDSCLRLECRLKPGIPGHQLINLKNPFASINLIPENFSELAELPIHHQFIADSIRIGGLKRALRPLNTAQRKQLKAAYSTASPLIPDLNAFWAQWPEALDCCGLAKEFGIPKSTEISKLAA
jgi:hypothetical protein